jgi:hypothetical protein
VGFSNIILFQSEECNKASDAMEAFKTFQLPDKLWFAYMRVTKNRSFLMRRCLIRPVLTSRSSKFYSENLAVGK